MMKLERYTEKTNGDFIADFTDVIVIDIGVCGDGIHIERKNGVYSGYSFQYSNALHDHSDSRRILENPEETWIKHDKN